MMLPFLSLESSSALPLSALPLRSDVPDACGYAEWYFRSSLDRYVWIHGMVCAFMHPTAERWLKQLDSLAALPRIFARGLLIAGTPVLCPSMGNSAIFRESMLTGMMECNASSLDVLQ